MTKIDETSYEAKLAEYGLIKTEEELIEKFEIMKKYLKLRKVKGNTMPIDHMLVNLGNYQVGNVRRFVEAFGLNEKYKAYPVPFFEPLMFRYRTLSAEYQVSAPLHLIREAFLHDMKTEDDTMIDFYGSLLPEGDKEEWKVKKLFNPKADERILFGALKEEYLDIQYEFDEEGEKIEKLVELKNEVMVEFEKMIDQFLVKT